MVVDAVRTQLNEMDGPQRCSTIDAAREQGQASLLKDIKVEARSQSQGRIEIRKLRVI